MKKESRKKAKAEDVKICGLCGQMIIGDYENGKDKETDNDVFLQRDAMQGGRQL